MADKTMTQEEKDRLANECAAKLLQEGDIAGAAKIFFDLIPDKHRVLLMQREVPGGFNNGFADDGTPYPLE